MMLLLFLCYNGNPSKEINLNVNVRKQKGKVR